MHTRRLLLVQSALFTLLLATTALTSLGCGGSNTYQPATSYSSSPGLCSNAMDCLGRGLEANQAGNYDMSVRYNDQALAYGGLDAYNLSVAYHNRGNAHKELGNTQQAISDYTQAIQLDPNYGPSYQGRGSAYYTLGNYQQAIQDLSVALQYDPNNAACFRQRGRAYHHLDQYGPAIMDYEMAVRLDPNDAGIHNTYAWILATCVNHSARDGRRAVQLATRCVELTGGNNADYLDTLAAAYAQAGNFQEAVRVEQQAMAVARQQGVDAATIAQYEQRMGLYQQGRTIN